jgi:hypothetical protein
VGEHLENLPLPVKAILTSRKARVRKAVFPVEVNEFELKEALTYHFPRAIEGGELVVEYATVCFRSQEDFRPIEKH